jgi:hypothetical protein
MKKVAFFLLSAAVLTFTSCSKEGAEGPAGPAGPAGAAGPAGDDASFTVNTLTIAVADWAGGNYVEYPVDFINGDIYEEGMAIAYIQDDFGYWNAIPSQWHVITGFGFSFVDSDGDGAGDTGIVGFDAVNGAPTADVNARVVTMTSRDYEVLNSNGQIKNYNEVMTYLSKK